MSNRISDPKYLVGYWPLSKDADDYSGHGNHGIPTDITFIEGPFGKNVASFNGSSSYIQISNNAKHFRSNNISISFWLNKFSSLTTQFLIFKGPSNDLNMHFELRVNQESNKFFITGSVNNSYTNTAYSTAKKKDVTFISLVLTKSTASFYTNGQELRQRTGMNGSVNDTDIYVGRQRLDSFGNYFEGNIFELKYYNIALTAQEVMTLYKREK